MTNLSQIYFCMSETYKTDVSNRVLSTKSPLELVNSQRLFCSQKAGVKSLY